jgi:hypothetical protein
MLKTKDVRVLLEALRDVERHVKERHVREAILQTLRVIRDEHEAGVDMTKFLRPIYVCWKLGRKAKKKELGF